jgi:hypothetical protein
MGAATSGGSTRRPLSICEVGLDVSTVGAFCIRCARYGSQHMGVTRVSPGTVPCAAVSCVRGFRGSGEPALGEPAASCRPLVRPRTFLLSRRAGAATLRATAASAASATAVTCEQSPWRDPALCG